jgi:hypothetical protein
MDRRTINGELVDQIREGLERRFPQPVADEFVITTTEYANGLTKVKIERTIEARARGERAVEIGSR